MMKILYFLLLIFPFANLFSQNWRDSLIEAREAYKNEDFSKALNLYNSVQKQAPKDLDLSSEIGQCAYKSKQFEIAEKAYNKSKSQNGNRINKAKAFHNIGNIKMNQKNYQGAIESYKSSLRNNPSDEETRYNLSEAIRRLKKEQDKKDNNQNQKDKNKNQPPPKNDKKDQQKNNPKKKEEEGKEPEKKMSKNMMDKVLDKLAKDESETKKKVASTKGDRGETTSGKDW